MSDKLQPIYFMETMASTAKNTEPVYSTFAKVIEIKENGYYVDCEPVFLVDNSQVIENIPVIHNKYINHEIEVDDIVILLTLDHMQANYQEDKEINIQVKNKSYLAIPYAFLDDFQSANDTFSNKGLTLSLPNADYVINISADNGIQIQDKQAQHKITLNNNGISIQSASPIEIKTQSASLYNLLNDILTFLQSAQTGNCVNGSPTTTIGTTSQAQLTQFITTLGGLLK